MQLRLPQPWNKLFYPAPVLYKLEEILNSNNYKLYNIYNSIIIVMCFLLLRLFQMYAYNGYLHCPICVLYQYNYVNIVMLILILTQFSENFHTTEY